MKERTVAQLIELLPHSFKDLGSIMTLVAVCVKFARSSWDCVGFLWVLLWIGKV